MSFIIFEIHWVHFLISKALRNAIYNTSSHWIDVAMPIIFFTKEKVDPKVDGHCHFSIVG
jgi:hypothetical protein